MTVSPGLVSLVTLTPFPDGPKVRPRAQVTSVECGLASDTSGDAYTAGDGH